MYKNKKFLFYLDFSNYNYSNYDYSISQNIENHRNLYLSFSHYPL